MCPRDQREATLMAARQLDSVILEDSREYSQSNVFGMAN